MGLRIEIRKAISEGDHDEFFRLVSVEDAIAKDTYPDISGSHLHTCAKNSRLVMANHLLRLGADVNHRGGVWQATPLVYAAANDHVEMMQLLHQNGGVFEINGPLVCNPIFVAIENDRYEAVKWLLEQGLEPHATYRSADGKLINAYSWAKDFRRTEVVALLESYGCHLPVEGEDIPVWEATPAEPEPASDQIVEFMEFHFGNVDEKAIQELAPVVEGMTVSVHVIPPNEEHPHYVLFTSGMSDLAMTTPKGSEDWQHAELVMHLPPDWMHPGENMEDAKWNWPVLLLRKLAYAPHLAETWLGLPSTIISNGDPPEPLGPEVPQTCSLLMPDFANLAPPLTLSDGRTVHFWTVVPLYTQERDFELKHGMKKFFEQFMSHKVPMTVQHSRPSF